MNPVNFEGRYHVTFYILLLVPQNKQIIKLRPSSQIKQANTNSLLGNLVYLLSIHWLSQRKLLVLKLQP